MGLPVWREPVEKRETEAALDPRRAAISRRPRYLDSSRPRIRASDRSSETLFNLLRSDYALESMNVGPLSSFSTERRGLLSHWNDMNAIPTPVPDPERTALRVSLSDSEPRTSRGGLRRIRSPVPTFRSEASRGSEAGASSEAHTPRFPPTFPELEVTGQPLREIEREIEREGLRQIERERERERERQDFDERRRFRPPFTVAATESATTHRTADESGVPRFRFPARIPRYLADVADENDNSQRSGSYMARSLHLPRFDIDGLGDRERSLRSTFTDLSLFDELGLIDDIYSPDATQWELVANDLGFQAACDLWESEESDGEGGELVIPDHLWDAAQDRDEAFRMRRFTSLFSSRNTVNREVDRLAERL